MLSRRSLRAFWSVVQVSMVTGSPTSTPTGVQMSTSSTGVSMEMQHNTECGSA